MLLSIDRAFKKKSCFKKSVRKDNEFKQNDLFLLFKELAILYV